MSHPFGDLLRQYRARKTHLTQTRLAELAGYDQAVLTRMSQGKKDLTGPSGRERVLRLIAVLRDEGALATQNEANALLTAANMPPLFDGQPEEAMLIKALMLEGVSAVQPVSTRLVTDPYKVAGLPIQLTHFVGREHELTEVRQLLTTTRLLTLTGSGGCGKTRLALEVGAHSALVITPSAKRATARVAPTFGVWLVDFAALAEDRLVADTVAATLGLHTASRSALEVLIDYLYDQEGLLILDNCEHLIQGCAELAVALLRNCPRLHLLVTSREPLNVPGEVTWRVPPMALDEASELFTERARAARPDFAITSADAEAVAQICRRLDNMPLALELAAARVRTFTTIQVAARLDDAFRLLIGGSRVALPRQQTLRATIDWSYNLLTEEERGLLRELSVFSGGWTMEAAETIHGTGAAELLEQLVNKSLVVAEHKSDEGSTGMRYMLLETIRQYARDKLAAAGAEVERAARQRHLDYYASLEQAAHPHISADGPERKVWVDLLVPEVDNLRRALDWAAQSGNWQSGQRLVYTMGSIWCEPGCANPGSTAEMTKWLDVVILSNPAASDAARVLGLLMMANSLGGGGDMDRYVAWVRNAWTLAHRMADKDLTRETDAMLGATMPDDAEATALLNRVLQHAQRAGQTGDEVRAIMSLGSRMTLQGDCRQATELLEHGVLLARQLGRYSALTVAAYGPLLSILWRLGQAYLQCGDYIRARAALEESLTRTREAGNSDPEVLIDLGTIGVYTGDYAVVHQALQEGFPNFYQRDNQERVAQTLVLAASLAHVLGSLMMAARLLGAAAAIRRNHHTHGIFERELFAEYDRRLPAVRAAMDPAAFDQAWAEGQKLSIKQAITEALAI